MRMLAPSPLSRVASRRGLSQQPDFWLHQLDAAKLTHPVRKRFTNFGDCYLLYQAAATVLAWPSVWTRWCISR
jgi:hypothetical protein